MQNTTMDRPATVIPQGTGYFASDSTLPLHAPDFNKISTPISSPPTSRR